MKVHFIIGTLGGGGAERVMTLLADYFSAKGHDVSLLTLNDTRDFYQVDKQVKRVRLHGGSFPVMRVRNLINLMGYYRVRSNRPDVAISFLTATNIIAIVACRAFKVPVIVSEHNNHLFVPHPQWFTKWAWNRIYRMADYVTVLTSFDVDYFQRKKSRVVVMPNPCTFEALKVNQGQRDKVVLAIGNLNRYHHKGLDNLIEIAKPVLEEYPGWQLKIVGSGETGREYLEDLMRHNGIEKGIEFTGFREDVLAMMRNASIFILPSRFEGLPMVLLEAMSQGMACIAYDCITGPGDMIDDRKNGLLIPDQDKKAMEDGLRALIRDPGLRETLGNHAIKSLDRYSIEAVYSRWESLIAIFN